MKVQTFLLSRNLLIFCLHSAQNLLIFLNSLKMKMYDWARTFVRNKKETMLY